MTKIPLSSVLFLVLHLASPALAQTFSGPYIGVDVSRQHYIGGSVVNGIDVLQEDSRIVASLFGGIRWQTRGFVLGGELGRGRADGDLRLETADLTIDYRNRWQGHWQLHAGHTIGRGSLLYGYLSEVTRQFDVTISDSGQSTTQQDEQGMLRFGAGVEQQLTNRLRLRLTAGSSRADFGDRATNKAIGRRLELGGGLVVQF